MNIKPITPTIHGLNDYGFCTVFFLVPALLGLNKKLIGIYGALGANQLLINSLTDHPVALKPVIPYRTHGVLDVISVIGLAALAANKKIRSDKKALLFHAGFVALATVNILLTDWSAKDGAA